MSNSLPSTTVTNLAQFNKLISYYPAVAEAHYKIRLKNDSAKVKAALERDAWRYDGLSDEILSTVTFEYDDEFAMAPLDLAKLSRLVEWKITHGHSRPFLPAMIRKNDNTTVKKVTGRGASSLTSMLRRLPDKDELENDPDPSNRSDKIDWAKVYQDGIQVFCELKGVGPATASLVGSVYSSWHVPFFADETYAWLVDGGKVNKLKYDRKEYMALLEAVERFRARIIKEGMPVWDAVRVGSMNIEKAAFVAMHLDLLDEEKRAEFYRFFAKREKEKEVKKKDCEATGVKAEAEADAVAIKGEQQEEKETEKAPTTKRKGPNLPTRQSKRSKQTFLKTSR